MKPQNTLLIGKNFHNVLEDNMIKEHNLAKMSNFKGQKSVNAEKCCYLLSLIFPTKVSVIRYISVVRCLSVLPLRNIPSFSH